MTWAGWWKFQTYYRFFCEMVGQLTTIICKFRFYLRSINSGDMCSKGLGSFIVMELPCLFCRWRYIQWCSCSLTWVQCPRRWVSRTLATGGRAGSPWWPLQWTEHPLVSRLSRQNLCAGHPIVDSVHWTHAHHQYCLVALCNTVLENDWSAPVIDISSYKHIRWSVVLFGSLQPTI